MIKQDSLVVVSQAISNSFNLCESVENIGSSTQVLPTIFLTYSLIASLILFEYGRHGLLTNGKNDALNTFEKLVISFVTMAMKSANEWTAINYTAYLICIFVKKRRLVHLLKAIIFYGTCPD
jgi:hypothetical protein